ncbi:hypothetical protein EV192_104655 [Actinocrispum wychmicini]|uniref:Uncharacterized protein n=1 Tax=Actinocrispum wychmicini TaxID=1213861 RepID=A0A4R2JMH0_9PSEU|nr:hypothetical protein EV192_104655 [Actinocrispum wychmicini]
MPSVFAGQLTPTSVSSPLSDLPFCLLISLAVGLWSAVLVRWLWAKSGIGQRFAVWRWRRQGRARRR